MSAKVLKKNPSYQNSAKSQIGQKNSKMAKPTLLPLSSNVRQCRALIAHRQKVPEK